MTQEEINKLNKDQRFIKFLIENPEQKRRLFDNNDLVFSISEDGKEMKIVSKGLSKREERMRAYIRERNELTNMNINRADEMRDLRITGMTLDEIGKKYNLTRERVRQILKQFFPFEDLNIYHKSLAYEDTVCGYCKKDMRCLVTKKTKYCSKICSGFGSRKHQDALWKETPEYKAECAKRAYDYYHKHKNEPRHKAKIKEYNRRYNLRVQSEPILRAERNKRLSDYQKLKRKNATSKSISTDSSSTIS